MVYRVQRYALLSMHITHVIFIIDQTSACQIQLVPIPTALDTHGMSNVFQIISCIDNDSINMAI